MRNRLHILGTALFVVTVAIGAVSMAGIGVAQERQCEPIEDRQLCISEFSITEEQVLVGDAAEFTIRVTNEGNTSATGKMLLHTASPNNESEVYQFEAFTLDPEEEATVSRTLNASTLGTHGLRVSLSEPSTQHVYDVSEIKTIEVVEKRPAGLGGPIDRTEIALGALLLSLLGLLGLGYREYRG